MGSINKTTMRNYLSKSISSLNRNKVNGMLAEIDLRNMLAGLGYSDKISQGGWIARSTGNGVFGHYTSVLFPMTILPNHNYAVGRAFTDPPLGLHTICATMHQIGVRSFYCVPSIAINNDYNSISWEAKQLGIPVPPAFSPLTTAVTNFALRGKRYGFLRYTSKASQLPAASLAEEFTKEHLRISFQSMFLSEISDIDGVFWGQQHTYPLEIKEKTVANDSKVGNYFGLDVGPFVKLAFYAAKKGNLHSLFIVKEINNTTQRQLVNWWYITFDVLAQYASWVSVGGGTNMQGGRSTVIKIPRAEFLPMTAANLASL